MLLLLLVAGRASCLRLRHQLHRAADLQGSQGGGEISSR